MLRLSIPEYSLRKASISISMLTFAIIKHPPGRSIVAQDGTAARSSSARCDVSCRYLRTRPAWPTHNHDTTLPHNKMTARQEAETRHHLGARLPRGGGRRGGAAQTGRANHTVIRVVFAFVAGCGVRRQRSASFKRPCLGIARVNRNTPHVVCRQRDRAAQPLSRRRDGPMAAGFPRDTGSGDDDAFCRWMQNVFFLEYFFSSAGVCSATVSYRTGARYLNAIILRKQVLFYNFVFVDGIVPHWYSFVARTPDTTKSVRPTRPNSSLV